MLLKTKKNSHGVYPKDTYNLIDPQKNFTPSLHTPPLSPIYNQHRLDKKKSPSEQIKKTGHKYTDLTLKAMIM